MVVVEASRWCAGYGGRGFRVVYLWWWWRGSGGVLVVVGVEGPHCCTGGCGGGFRVSV